MRKVASIALAAAVGLAVGARPLRAQAVAQWTVMVYLNGDPPAGVGNYENSTIRDFNEMEQVGSTQAVNCVVQWDRSPRADDLSGVFAPTDTTNVWETTRRYLVIADPLQAAATPQTLTVATGLGIASPALVDLGEVDMGQEDNLVAFYQWTVARFPAQHYALVLNGPGQGWQPRMAKGRGIIFDGSTAVGQTNDPSQFLTNAELKSAMSRIKTLRGGTNLECLLLDSGGTATVEVENQVKDSVDYVLGEFLDRGGNGPPDGGLPYDTLLTSLNGTLPSSPASIEAWLQPLASGYLGLYGAGTLQLGGDHSVAVGVTRTSNLQAILTASDDLAKALDSSLLSTAPGLYRVLSVVQRGRPGDYTGNYIDLRNFAELCITEFAATQSIVDAATEVVATVTAAEIIDPSGATGTNDVAVNTCHGLGVYFPATLANYDSTYTTASDFGQTEWPRLVQGLLTLYSDRNPPLISVLSPVNGATILENPPTIVATIVDPDAVGGVDPNSVALTFDGSTVPATAYSFDATSGALRYALPTALAATSHIFTISAKDLSGNEAVPVTGNFRIAIAQLTAGLQTFSLPRMVTSADADPSSVFGVGNFAMARWVSSLTGSDKYRLYPDAYSTFLPPDAGATLLKPIVAGPPAGLGYWVRVKQTRPLQSLPGTPVSSAEYTIQCFRDPGGTPGWNMIGNPYDVAAVGLASTYVLATDGRKLTFQQAIDNRITPGVLFTYVPNAADANAPGRYDFGDAGTGQLVRLQGHWLKANANFGLVVASGTGRQTLPVAKAVERAKPRGGWSFELWAQATVANGALGSSRGYTAEDRAVLGVSQDTTDGFDSRWDVAGPPALPGGVAVRVQHADWGADSGRYIRDLRGVGAAVAWDVDVNAPAGEITLSWPSLKSVPGDTDVVLTDLTTGKTRAMRATASYTFTHKGGSRALRVSAQPRNGAGLVLGDVTLTPGRGGTGYEIGYTLSAAAEVRVVIGSLTGRTLRVIGPQTAPVGRGRQAWDGQDDSGRPLPNGVYQVEVVAEGADGAAVRTLRTVRVVR